MRITRRQFGQAALALPLVPAVPAALRAREDWPSRPISWVVGYPAGGATDVFARLIGNEVARALARPVVVENRVGASAILATESVVRAPADGHTLLSVDNGMMVYSPALYDKLPFDPDRDLAKVTLVFRAPFFVIVRRDSPFASFADLLRAASQRQLLFGSPGPSSPHHVAMQLLRRRSGLALLDVPHRGMPVVMPELLAGRLDVTIGDIVSVISMLQGGEVRALLALQDTRVETFPDVPCARETGYDVTAAGWQGVCAPRGTPAEIIARLDQAIRQAIATEQVGARLRQNGVVIDAAGPEHFEAFAQAENARWRPLIRELGWRVDR